MGFVLERRIIIPDGYGYGPLETVAPDVNLPPPPGSDQNGSGKGWLALHFIAGGMYVFVFTEPDRQAIVAAMSGGIQIAQPGDLPQP